MLLRKKAEIETWLNQYGIKNYELIEDNEYGFVINVNGNVDLDSKKLISIDIKFNKVEGFFSCNDNLIETLEGCPEIVEDSFYCYQNKLKTLKYSPKIGNGNFNCFIIETDTIRQMGRQLKRFDIKVSGRDSDCVSKFFSSNHKNGKDTEALDR